MRPAGRPISTAPKNAGDSYKHRRPRVWLHRAHRCGEAEGSADRDPRDGVLLLRGDRDANRFCIEGGVGEEPTVGGSA